MAYKTINVSPTTYERLVIYKVGNQTFDDILNRLMDQVSEEKFYKKVLAEHRKRMKRIKAGEYIEWKDLDKALE